MVIVANARRSSVQSVMLGRRGHGGHDDVAQDLTSIVFCASNGLRPLLIAGAAFFPVGMIHGIGVWFGGW